MMTTKVMTTIIARPMNRISGVKGRLKAFRNAMLRDGLNGCTTLLDSNTVDLGLGG